jgi:hypothetical protein
VNTRINGNQWRSAFIALFAIVLTFAAAGAPFLYELGKSSTNNSNLISRIDENSLNDHEVAQTLLEIQLQLTRNTNTIDQLQRRIETLENGEIKPR